ncbi:hypothetical protein [Streptomyces sp. NPDC060001]|uniref:hypothetical protein n=1 Tax=Streptomyces sp. NPDC060001 TaxID=3347032 RepID=UPI0036A349D4
MSVYWAPPTEHDDLIRAALRVIGSSHYGRESDPHWDAEKEYADEQLALAARALVDAVDGKPADEQPIGWARQTAADLVLNGKTVTPEIKENATS